jgi:hypothetical protein
MTTVLQILLLLHPRVLSLTRTYMKTIDPTEELVIATILLISDAIGTITTQLLVPGISLVLAGLGWRPPTRPKVVPPEPGTPYLTQVELHGSFFDMELEPSTPFFPWHADDLADDYSREVPTAEERSPSLRRRGGR